MRIKIITLFYFLFTFTICNAQSNSNPKNYSLSFELGKNGLMYNAVFDQRFEEKDFGYRIAIGSNFGKYLKVTTSGAGGYYLSGRENNYLELGVDFYYLSIEEISDDQRGVVLITPDYPIKTFYASANIGYRLYQKNTLFRVGISPGFIKDGFLPGGYISFGYRF